MSCLLVINSHFCMSGTRPGTAVQCEPPVVNTGKR